MNTPDSLEVTVARIETKLDAWNHQQTADAARAATQHTDHETRIRALERAKWTAAGFAAAGGGAVGTILTKLIGG
ncbi:hypothetical protein BLA60_25855 [Actinophytocola xinjiangensis]|uniref:Uncharacterized protein n=1 Tax=Actinophytocola xinjiangensis TaxID=485602 RepID=A0A7Z0WJ93_9PSEU|nr:hypothetical protein [Actinophytocola xinjiangensis]OLF07757.1 hypothetical protein BLA60_25855 [Actinophytocola xinjiangensis]